MIINGKRVIKTRVRVLGDKLELTFYGKSPRGTPIILGAITPRKADLHQALIEAPAKLARPVNPAP